MEAEYRKKLISLSEEQLTKNAFIRSLFALNSTQLYNVYTSLDKVDFFSIKSFENDKKKKKYEKEP